MYALLIIFHVAACLILIVVILLQAGRGGGLSELFGSGSTQTIFGTRASTFLTRATTIAAIAFLLTCLSLTVLSSRRVKSLMSSVRQTPIVKSQSPQAATPQIPQEVAESKPEQPMQEEPSGGSEQNPQIPQD